MAVARPCCPGDEQKHQGLLQNTCFSSACPACALATWLLTPGAGPVHDVWSYHDVPWVSTAKLWVLLRISHSGAPDPRGHTH